MDRSYRAFLVVTCALLGATLSRVEAQSALAQAPADYAEAIEFASTLIAAVMEESGTPGMSVAVGVDGDIVWAEGFGYADVEHRVSVWQETKFRIGSVSKPLTATAVGLLVERGQLDLDAPVQRYVPTFPEKRWPITTRQAAGHLAGIRHYNGGEMYSSRRYQSVSRGLRIFQDDTLRFQPGTRYSYSSYGWNLVSAVIEGASDERFLSYMQQQVFDPIGMRHTVADYTDSIIPHRTRFYQPGRDGRAVNAIYVDNSYKWAGGGFLSTPSDLIRFGFAYLDGELLAAETIAQLWTPQTTNDGKSTGYGIGWSVRLEDGVVVSAGHNGGSIGGTTGFTTRPRDRTVVALVGNMTRAPATGLILALITEAFVEPTTAATTDTGLTQAPVGAFQCTMADSAEEAKGTMHLGGSVEHTWGRIEWEDGTVDRVIYASNTDDELRLITVNGRAILTELRLAVDDTELRGTVRRRGQRPITCGTT
jgi:serine beta-lactamase-like protein LACTB